jgi:hypothetical protein
VPAQAVSGPVIAGFVKKAENMGTETFEELQVYAGTGMIKINNNIDGNPRSKMYPKNPLTAFSKISNRFI